MTKTDSTAAATTAPTTTRATPSRISRILVPTDFSSHADEALRYATTLAVRLGASLDLLHVVEEQPPATRAWTPSLDAQHVSDLQETRVSDATSRIESRQLAAASVGASMLGSVRLGQAIRAIVEYAASEQVDLVVMGTLGLGGATGASMGHVAACVARYSPCPVLTVRDYTQRADAELPGIQAQLTSAQALGSSVLRAALGHHGSSRE